MGMEGPNNSEKFKWTPPWEIEGAREIKEEDLDNLSEEDKKKVEVWGEEGNSHWYIPAPEK